MAKEYRAIVTDVTTSRNNQQLVITTDYFQKGNRQDVADTLTDNFEVDDFNKNQFVRLVRDRVREYNKKSNDADVIINDLKNIRIDGDGIVNTNDKNLKGGD